MSHGMSPRTSRLAAIVSSWSLGLLWSSPATGRSSTFSTTPARTWWRSEWDPEVTRGASDPLGTAAVGSAVVPSWWGPSDTPLRGVERSDLSYVDTASDVIANLERRLGEETHLATHNHTPSHTATQPHSQKTPEFRQLTFCLLLCYDGIRQCSLSLLR
jgi:hypothetical protein